VGNSAEYYYNIARGIDHRAVSSQRVRKSLGSETTFQQDISDIDEMLKQLSVLLDEVLESLKKRELVAYTLTLKVKYSDFTQVTRCHTSDSIISVRKNALEAIPVLLAKTEAHTQSVRLLGISFSNLLDHEKLNDSQLTLF